MEGRIRQLEYLIENAEIVEAADRRHRRPGQRGDRLFEGDPESDAERYLVGHIEEQHPRLRGDEPDKSPLGRRADRRHAPATSVHYDAPNGAELQVKRPRRWSCPERDVSDAGDRACGEPPPRTAMAGAAAAGARDVRPRVARTRGRADRRAAARVDGDRRPQLLHRPTGRSPSTTASSPSTIAATGAGIRSRAGRSGSPTAPTTRVRDGRRLGIDRYVPVGYSMGGPVAQLRAGAATPDTSSGSCSCATRQHFGATTAQRMTFLGLTGLAGLARLTPAAGSRLAHRAAVPAARRRAVGAVGGAGGGAARLADGARGAAARSAVPTSDAWLGDVDVPTSVILTMRDQVVPLGRQLQPARRCIPTATAFRSTATTTRRVAVQRSRSCRRCSTRVARSRGRHQPSRVGTPARHAVVIGALRSQPPTAHRWRPPSALGASGAFAGLAGAPRTPSASAAAARRGHTRSSSAATSTSPGSGCRSAHVRVDRGAQAVRLGRAAGRARRRARAAHRRAGRRAARQHEGRADEARPDGELPRRRPARAGARGAGAAAGRTRRR